MQPSSQAGLISAIIANVAINLALNLQRYATTQLARLALHGVQAMRPPNYIWWVGMGILIVGECTNFIAYGLAPASIVSPLGVLAVISNCVIPPLLFDETPSIHSIIGTIIALPGITLLILSSPQAEEKLVFPLDDSQRLFLTVSLLSTFGLALLWNYLKKDSAWYMRVSAILSAQLGTYTVLAIKTIATLLRTPGNNTSQLMSFLVLTVVVCTLLQLVILSDIMGRFAVWQVVPHHFAAFTIFVGIGSAILFHEFSHSTSGEKLEFLSGCLLTIIGVWMSAKPHEHRPSRRASIVRFPSALKAPNPQQRTKYTKNQRKRFNKKKKKQAAKERMQRPAPATPVTIPANRPRSRRTHSDLLLGSRGSRESHRSNQSHHTRYGTEHHSTGRSRVDDILLEEGGLIWTSPVSSFHPGLHHSIRMPVSRSVPVYEETSLLVPVDTNSADWQDLPDTSREERTYVLMPRRFIETAPQSLP